MTAPAEEREFKFLLTEEEYASLWQRLRPESSPMLQQNVFFDFDGRLEERRWALRFRLEGPPVEQALDPETIPSLYELTMRPERAAFTMKGPARMEDGAMVRAEIEADVPLDAAQKIAVDRSLSREDIPQKIVPVLNDALGSEKPPASFEVKASFRNLRLVQVVGTPSCGVEVALDKAETADGRHRLELEVEVRGDGVDTAREVMQNLGVARLAPAGESKLAWAIASQGRS